nr:MAG TPA: hypothetical protein [Caudoviricetes sp.]
MITAKEAQRRSSDVAEEGIKNQLSEISKLIEDACKSGQRRLCIENVGKKFFPNKQDLLDAVFVLGTKYGYETVYGDYELNIYWY